MNDLDSFTAYAALLTSLAGLAWHFRNWWYDAPDLRLSGGRIIEIVGEPVVATVYGLWQPSTVFFEVSLENHGHQEIYVQGIGVEMATGESFELGDGTPLAAKPDNLPAFLKAGESTKVQLLLGLVFDAGLLAGTRPEVSRLCAIDGRQRRWWLPEEDFRRLRADARARIENLKKEEQARAALQRAQSGMAEVAAENEADAEASESDWSAEKKERS